jgi:hypothetical protein
LQRNTIPAGCTPVQVGGRGCAFHEHDNSFEVTTAIGSNVTDEQGRTWLVLPGCVLELALP